MRILITGATSGIGRSLTEQYVHQGYDVIACGRNEVKLHELKTQYKLSATFCFDLTDYQNYPNMDDSFEPLDLLIFNAGDCEYIKDALNFDAEKFERVININLISIGYGLQTWLKHLKPGGRLVLISSSAGLLPLPRAEAYGASKAALTYLAKTLSIHLAQHHIAVTVVHPGFVSTPLTDKNDFAMPMIISQESAAKKIIQGIAKGQADISFPTLFILVMKCLRFLPSSLWNRLATRMVTS
jgi:short-subunit dehydrogenase